MLSLPLAAALMGALQPKCQLVLVGDVDQLPPIGEAGARASAGDVVVTMVFLASCMDQSTASWWWWLAWLAAVAPPLWAALAPVLHRGHVQGRGQLFLI